MIKKLLVLMLVCLLVLPMVNAFDFDNVKEYDKNNKVITIKNAFGLGETLVRMQLMTPHHNKVGVGKDVQVAVIKIHEFRNIEGSITGVSTYDVLNDMKEVKHFLQNSSQWKFYKRIEGRGQILFDGFIPKFSEDVYTIYAKQ